MPFTLEQEAEAAAYIQAIKTAQKEADQVKEVKALENLKALFLRIDTRIDNVRDFESIMRLAAVRVDFERLTQLLSAKGQIAFVVIQRIIQLIIEISNNRGRIDNELIRNAAKWGYVDCFRLLRETYGVDVNKDLGIRGDGQPTALHIAAVKGHIDLVKFLLTLPKVNVDIQNGLGETPLFLAVKHNAVEMVRCLLEHKAQVNTKIRHQIILVAAASTDFNVSIDVFRVLIAYGADVNAYDKSSDNTTALNYAIRKEEIEKVRLLLENRAHINKASYEFCRNPQIHTLLDDFKPISNADIDNILDNLHRPSILREALLDTNLVIPDIVNTIIVPYAHQLEEDIAPDDKSVQTGPAMSRIARVRQALQEDLPALVTAGIITAEKEQAVLEYNIIYKLKDESLRAECLGYCEQRRQAQMAGRNPAAIIPPWTHLEVLKTAVPLESKGMEATSITTTSALGQLPIDTGEVVAETKEMSRAEETKETPKANRRDDAVSSSAAARRTPGVGFGFNAGKEADATPPKT